jgi:hypothetical protein
VRRLPFVVSALTAAVAPALGTGARAADSPEQIALQKLFAKGPIDPALFAPNFLSKIPVSDVQSFVDSYTERLGAPTAIVKDGFEWSLASPKGTIKVNIAFDAQGRISSLLFHDELSPDDLAALQHVLGADKLDPLWFEASFLSDAPLEKLQSVLTGMHGALGAFLRVDTRSGKYIAVFEKGESHAQISTDPDGKINYLAFSKL